LTQQSSGFTLSTWYHIGGNVGSDHLGRHMQVNPISPSWDVFGLLWLLPMACTFNVCGFPRRATCACLDSYLALFGLWHGSGVVCKVVKHCIWFAEVLERNVTSFAEEGKMQVSVRVKGWMVKHLFDGST
jgi:hypothetical protein